MDNIYGADELKNYAEVGDSKLILVVVAKFVWKDSETPITLSHTVYRHPPPGRSPSYSSVCHQSAYPRYEPGPESGHVTQYVLLAAIQLALVFPCPVTNYLTLTQSRILPAPPQAPEFK